VIFLEQVVLPAGGSILITLEIRQKILSHATKLAGKVVCRLEHRSDLSSMEPEDIEQELLAYVLEHMDRFNPGRGSIEAFTTRLMQNAVAKLIRESNKVSCNPPEGVELQSLSKTVEGPHRKSESLTKGIATSDNDRRRQTVSRDPLQDLDLADAIEHQIRTLPGVYRKFARLLQTCNQAESGFRLGWSRRRISEAMGVIRQHFAGVEWGEIDFFRDEVRPNCIASTGEDDYSIHDHDTNTEKPL
jgi:DNA-directed RNA polymerase specialized sigma24 family protein